MAPQPPLNDVPSTNLDEGLTKLASKLVAGTKDLTSLKHQNRVCAKPNAIAIEVCELLFDQPLLPARHRSADIAAKSSVTDRKRRLRREFPVYPGGRFYALKQV